MTDRIDTALVIHPDFDDWEYVVDTSIFADEILEENVLDDTNSFWGEQNRLRDHNCIYTEQT